MSVAAIAIDNFLDSSKWNTIQAGISEYLNAPLYSENRTSLQTDINSWIKEKLSTLGLWNNLWEDEIKLFSSINSNCDKSSSKLGVIPLIILFALITICLPSICLKLSTHCMVGIFLLSIRSLKTCPGDMGGS